jgi:hypothetical protein
MMSVFHKAWTGMTTREGVYIRTLCQRDIFTQHFIRSATLGEKEGERSTSKLDASYAQSSY